MQPFDLAQSLEQRGGAARRAVLLEAGVKRRDIDRAVVSGDVIRVREGVYGAASATDGVLLAAHHGGEVACIDALRAAGVWVLPAADGRPHVWIGGKGRRHPHPGCRCIDHHDAGGAAFGIVRVPLALVQCASCCDEETFFAAFESAWRLGLVDREDRAWIRQRVPAVCRRLIDIARADADSGLESLLRLRLHRLGIAVETQVLVVGVGRVDFVIAGRLIIEVDGRENHDGPSQRHKDLVRDAAAAALGYERLRFDYALVIHQWHVVEAAILSVLGRTPVPVVGS